MSNGSGPWHRDAGNDVIAKLGQRSSVVEQRFRKPQVDGSNPSVGSVTMPITTEFAGNRDAEARSFSGSTQVSLNIGTGAAS